MGDLRTSLYICIPIVVPTPKPTNISVSHSPISNTNITKEITYLTITEDLTKYNISYYDFARVYIFGLSAKRTY